MALATEKRPVLKLRVLCLHGLGTSGNFLCSQIQKWDSSIIEKLDMCFLDGQFPAGGKSEMEGKFPPPYYDWFQYLDKGYTRYNNLDNAYNYITDYMEKNGPFDGLLGFSQGAVLSAALVGYQRKGMMLKNHVPIKFIISISGAKLRDPEMVSIIYCPPIKCPSVHIIGAKDWLKESSELLAQAFESPLVIRHQQGHTVPRLDDEAVNLLKQFIDNMLFQKVEDEETSASKILGKGLPEREKVDDVTHIFTQRAKL